MNDWQPMETSPKTGPCSDVMLLHKDGSVKRGHWAYGDGDGLMPPFGPAWFEQVIDPATKRCMYCRELTGPFVGWKPVEPDFPAEHPIEGDMGSVPL